MKLEKDTTLENEKDTTYKFSKLFAKPSLRVLTRDRRRVEIMIILNTTPCNPEIICIMPTLVFTCRNGAGPTKRKTMAEKILPINVKTTGYRILSAI